eukprot:5383699-Amphidinium_carterae.1
MVAVVVCLKDLYSQCERCISGTWEANRRLRKAYISVSPLADFLTWVTSWSLGALMLQSNLGTLALGSPLPAELPPATRLPPGLVVGLPATYRHAGCSGPSPRSRKPYHAFNKLGYRTKPCWLLVINVYFYLGCPDNSGKRTSGGGKDPPQSSCSP